MGVCVCVSEQGGDDNLPSSLGSRTRGGEAAVAECGRPDVWGRGGQSHPSSMGRGVRDCGRVCAASLTLLLLAGCSQ